MVSSCVLVRYCLRCERTVVMWLVRHAGWRDCCCRVGEIYELSNYSRGVNITRSNDYSTFAIRATILPSEDANFPLADKFLKLISQNTLRTIYAYVTSYRKEGKVSLIEACWLIMPPYASCYHMEHMAYCGRFDWCSSKQLFATLETRSWNG